MANYTPHLYMICYPNSSLVASQLTPEEFGAHYSFGSTSYYDGKLIYAELDITFRHPFFEIDRGLEKLIPHKDGSIRASKYIASYRVLEHIDLSMIKKLYLANADGSTFGLAPKPYDKESSPDKMRIFAEVAPVRMLCVSKYTFLEYGKWFTAKETMNSVPKILYTQLQLNIEQFLEDFEKNPLMPSPIPSIHPSKLRDAITQLIGPPGKSVKGLTLDNAFNKESYRSIKHGFMIASSTENLFFPFPSLSEIEKENLRFWKNM